MAKPKSNQIIQDEGHEFLEKGISWSFLSLKASKIIQVEGHERVEFGLSVSFLSLNASKS